jgi:hypothetical protein
MKEINALKNLELSLLGGGKKAGTELTGIFFGSVLHRTLTLFSAKPFTGKAAFGRGPATGKTANIPVIKILVKNTTPGKQAPAMSKTAQHMKQPAETITSREKAQASQNIRNLKEILKTDSDKKQKSLNSPAQKHDERHTSQTPVPEKQASPSLNREGVTGTIPEKQQVDTPRMKSANKKQAPQTDNNKEALQKDLVALKQRQQIIETKGRQR